MVIIIHRILKTSFDRLVRSMSTWRTLVNLSLYIIGQIHRFAKCIEKPNFFLSREKELKYLLKHENIFWHHCIVLSLCHHIMIPLLSFIHLGSTVHKYLENLLRFERDRREEKKQKRVSSLYYGDKLS